MKDQLNPFNKLGLVGKTPEKGPTTSTRSLDMGDTLNPTRDAPDPTSSSNRSRSTRQLSTVLTGSPRGVLDLRLLVEERDKIVFAFPQLPE